MGLCLRVFAEKRRQPFRRMKFNGVRDSAYELQSNPHSHCCYKRKEAIHTPLSLGYDAGKIQKRPKNFVIRNSFSAERADALKSYRYGSRENLNEALELFKHSANASDLKTLRLQCAAHPRWLISLQFDRASFDRAAASARGRREWRRRRSGLTDRRRRRRP